MASATGFIGVGIVVGDLGRSTAFYTGMLGYSLRDEIRLEYIDEDVLVLPGSDVALVLMNYKDGTSNVVKDPPVKVVVSTDDVVALVAKLRAAGHPITVEPTPYPGFGLIAFATDPDGYRVEIVQSEA